VIYINKRTFNYILYFVFIDLLESSLVIVGVLAIRSHSLLLLLEFHTITYVHHIGAIDACCTSSTNAQASILATCARPSTKLAAIGS